MTEPQILYKSLHPSLYTLADDGHSLNFHFARCSRCGGLSFPANAPGCMHCGAVIEEADKLLLPGEGTLLECVTLHVALVPGRPAPSIAGDILLAEGVVEEGVIAVSDESVLKPGMRLKAVAEMEEGEGVYACRFVPMREEVLP